MTVPSHKKSLNKKLKQILTYISNGHIGWNLSNYICFIFNKKFCTFEDLRLEKLYMFAFAI